MRRLDEKIEHWKARAAMPRAFPARLPVILRELRMLCHHRFSSGLPSVAKDLLI